MILSSAGSNCSIRVDAWAPVPPDMMRPPVVTAPQREPTRDAILNVLDTPYRIIATGEEARPRRSQPHDGELGTATPVGQARTWARRDRSGRSAYSSTPPSPS